MTESEAIERIEKCVCASKQNQNLCNDDCKYSADKCVFSLAIQALEKQIPKKPLYIENLGCTALWLCPVCERRIIRSDLVYCHQCGQKLDWSDEDERS